MMLIPDFQSGRRIRIVSLHAQRKHGQEHGQILQADASNDQCLGSKTLGGINRGYCNESAEAYQWHVLM